MPGLVANDEQATENMQAKRMGRERARTAQVVSHYGTSIWVSDWRTQYTVSGDEFPLADNGDGTVTMPPGTAINVTITDKDNGGFVTVSDGLPVPNYLNPRSLLPQIGVRVPLSGSALDEFNERKNRLLALLNNEDSACAKYLRKTVGVSGSRVARTLRAQRPFDGEKTTLTMAGAGIMRPGTTEELEDGVYVSSTETVASFFSKPFASAVHAGAASSKTGATPLDVYYGSGLDEYVILHETLHILLGLKDKDLTARGADLKSLARAGCNSVGDPF